MLGRPLILILKGAIPEWDVKIVSFERHSQDPERMYSLRVSFKGGQAEKRFDFNDHWLITHETLASKDGRRLDRELTYTNFEGRVLPSRLTVKVTDPSMGVDTPPAVTTFQNYRLYKGNSAGFQSRAVSPAGAWASDQRPAREIPLVLVVPSRGGSLAGRGHFLLVSGKKRRKAALRRQPELRRKKPCCCDRRTGCRFVVSFLLPAS